MTTLPDSGMGVAGDLVFFSESNGLLHAADAGTGKVLWTFDASTVPNARGANASPAFYVINGKSMWCTALAAIPVKATCWATR